LPETGVTANRAPQFAVWLPVSDYDGLVAKLGGTAGQQIAGVAIANESVFIARQGPWALVMDPDQRERMAQMLAAAPNPPSNLAAWSAWIDSNDIAAVLLPTGLRAVYYWAAATRRTTPQNAANNPLGFGQPGQPDDPFGAPADNAESSDDLIADLRIALGKWLASSPLLAKSLAQTKLFGCGLRLDDRGNLHADLRVLASEYMAWARVKDKWPSPPALYEGGNFVLNGTGYLPRPLVPIVAGAYVRNLIDDLKSEEGMVLADAGAQFHRVVERAAADVESLLVLTKPGREEQAVYTNDFLVVHAASADTFANNAREVMRIWNVMNRDAQAQTRLVFDVEDVKFGDRTATKYSLDIAAADGAPELPEIRQAMEQLFGPGGKLTLWIVPVDEHNVLLATATNDQVAAALKVLDRQRPVDWSGEEIAAVNRDLSADADWRLFFSPHHYNAWHRRQMDAITGPVIGGPIVKDFPSSPPIGFAGGVRDGEIWINAVVPPDTTKAASEYLKNKKRR
jgi:hypothetical protein